MMMEKDKFDKLMKEIEAMVIDERKIVTYKTLARMFNLNPNTAKQLLHSFVVTCGKSYDELSCAYQISGRKQDGSFYTSVINDKDLPDARKSLIDIFSETVYSVHPAHLADLQVLYSLDKFEETSGMNCQIITCTECVLKPSNAILKPIITVLKPKQEEANRPAALNKEEGLKANVKKPEDPKKKMNTKHEPKNSKATSITSMFAVQNQKPKVETVEKTEKADAKQKSKKEKVPMTRKEKEKSEEEPKEKRRRIRVFSSSEDEAVEVEEKERSPEPIPEPIVVPEESRENGNVARKRKIVDKTVMTEEGYIETIKEVVFQTDSEDEQPTEKSPAKTNVKKSPVKQASKKKSPTSPKKGKQKASTDGRKQASLLSFFKKT